MDDLTPHKREGAKIFRQAIEHISKYGWDHNTMDILLSVTPSQKWQQPMAVLMFSELEHELDGLTLTQFDKRTNDTGKVIDLLARVASGLEQS